jgi:hypothetical protein
MRVNLSLGTVRFLKIEQAVIASVITLVTSIALAAFILAVFAFKWLSEFAFLALLVPTAVIGACSFLVCFVCWPITLGSRRLKDREPT